MDDSVMVEERNTGRTFGPVVRRFSPVRIERLLLTRLFDLATGQAFDGSHDPRGMVMPDLVVSQGMQKEAA